MLELSAVKHISSGHIWVLPVYILVIALNFSIPSNPLVSHDYFSYTLTLFFSTESHKITVILIMIKLRLALSQAIIVYIYFSCFSFHTITRLIHLDFGIIHFSTICLHLTTTEIPIVGTLYCSTYSVSPYTTAIDNWIKLGYIISNLELHINCDLAYKNHWPVWFWNKRCRSFAVEVKDRFRISFKFWD